MRISKLLVTGAAALTVAACGKTAEAPAPAAAPAAEAAKPAEPAAKPAEAAPAPAAATATTAPAAPKATSVLTDACPMPGEDPASCPTKSDKVDDDIQVGHVLIGFAGSLPGKDVKRTKDEAKALATKIAHDARKTGSDFVKLVWEFSEDPGPGFYPLTPPMRGKMVPEFVAMGTSLGLNQVDVVETRFGYHVMKRVAIDYKAPEKPLEKVATDACPMPGEDKATCPTEQNPKPTETEVSHILLGYAGSLPGTPEKRTKEEAKALAIKLLHDARKTGADFAALVKANSQDPGPGTYPVSPTAGLVPPFKQLSLSLGVGQIDVVETSFGYHIIKRIK
jgi:hypothetical protein